MGEDGRSDIAPAPRASLLVVYTERLDACRDFYSDLGLDLVREQHGTGPVHYAVELAAGLVMELYPGASERTTGRLRLGLEVSASTRLPAGKHHLTDPDGRTVAVTAVAPPG